MPMRIFSTFYGLVRTSIFLDISFLYKLRSTSRGAVLLSANFGVRVHICNFLARVQVSSGIQHESGQYMFLRIPEVSMFEMHPFTISSAPTASQSRLTFHIKGMGSKTWTGKLCELADTMSENCSSTDLRVHMEGPYGAWSILPREFKRIILVAGGIGITPIMALATELQRMEFSLPKDTKIHLIWSSRDNEAFSTWFPEVWYPTICRHKDIVKHIIPFFYVHEFVVPRILLVDT